MEPTMYLRFVMRDDKRILQQFWEWSNMKVDPEDPWVDQANERLAGYWQDVPLETE